MKKWLFSHKQVFWVIYLPLYLALFFLVEKMITDNYWVSYMPIDDMIPFVPAFIVGYCMWYPLLFAVGFFLMFADSESFNRYMWTLVIGFTATLIFCLLFPNGQDLRPQLPEDGNIFIKIIQGIYRKDTNTNVLPSMHVIGAFAAVFAVWDSPRLHHPLWRISVIALAILISISTLFVKQHSLLDVLTGMGVGVILYAIVYVFIKRRQKKRIPIPSEPPSES